MARKKHKAEEIIQHLRTVEIEQSKGHSLQEASSDLTYPEDKCGEGYRYVSDKNMCLIIPTRFED